MKSIIILNNDKYNKFENVHLLDYIPRVSSAYSFTPFVKV
jgi:hypothetical protein